MPANKKRKSAKHLSKGKKLQAQKPLAKGSAAFEIKDWGFGVENPTTIGS